jgi:hypothetical protein
MAPPGGIPAQSEAGKGSETPKESTWEKSTTNTFFLLTSLKQHNDSWPNEKIAQNRFG